MNSLNITNRKALTSYLSSMDERKITLIAMNGVNRKELWSKEIDKVVKGKKLAAIIVVVE